ncbi:MAG TPA: hypothetical protein VNA24_07395, partial [Hyalangium sp.]|nr:hypothetical protein [Hyalangium sp.]
PPAERRIRYLLNRFEAGDLTAWHRINLEWVRTRIEKRNRPSFDELRSDLTLLPVWNALGSELRARCIDAAERYLKEGDPHLSEWFGTGIFHRVAAAGYRALRLVLEQRPAVIEGWPPELWARWVPVVIDWSWSYGKEEEQLQQKEEQLQASFVKEAYVRAPEALLSAVRDWLDRRDPERSIYTLTRKLVDCWDTRLVETVLGHVRANTRLKASHLGVLLDEVVPRSQEAVNVALQLVSSGADGDEAEEMKLEAARALLDKAPRAAWPQLWPIIEARPDFGEELIKRSVLYRLQSNELEKEFDEHSIADLYIWLERRFPPTDDKELKDFQLTGLLNRLLRELKQRGTEAAVSAVQRIAEALPDRGWLRLAVQQADEQRLRHEWQGIEPARLLEMAEGA